MKKNIFAMGAGDGPPDLEELWRDVQRRISGFFGSASRGGGGGGRGEGRSDPRLGVAIILAVIFLVWMGTGFYTVQEGQVGVVSTFGRFQAITGAGLRWRAPWPMQAHEIVDVFQQRKIDVGMRSAGPERLKEALMLTDDENIVDMQFEVQYRVKDGPQGARDYVYGSRFVRDVRDGDPGNIVKQCAESAMREVVGRRKMDEVLFGSRQQIADEVRAGMQGMLDRYNTGLLITAVAIQNAQPPDQVQAAFDDASKAVQDKERQINEGQAYANDIVPRARGDAARLLQEAEAYRVKVVETAEGDASRFRQILTEYTKAPAITRERMYLDTMQQVFSSTSKVLIDSKNGSQLLYLPLDKLIQQGGAGDGAARPSAVAPVGPAQPPVASDPVAGEPRTAHDPARTRDREGR
jgi:membrane protease subunit HflK